MNIYYNFQINKIIIHFIILYHIIYQIYSKISYIYPYAFTLSNGNIFIVHKYGIDIIDSSFSKIIKKVLIFSDEEIIETEEDLSKLAINNDKGFILCLIKEKIYIFNDNGYFLYKSDYNISVNQNVEYYTLLSILKGNESFYYLIGYFDNNNYLNLLYYKYKISQNNTELIQTKIERKFINYKLEEYNFKSKGLSCQYMNLLNSNYLLCFFTYKNISQYLTTSYYKINKTSINNCYNYKNPTFLVSNIIFIKSAINDSRNKVFISCYDIENEQILGLFFFFSSKKFINDFYYGKKCRNKLYSFKFNYIPETKEIIFSCIDYDGSLQADFYNKDMESPYTHSIKQFLTCESIYGHSILYLKSKQEYFILSDVLCNNTEVLLQNFFGEKIEDISQINDYYNEKEEETDKNKEEIKECNKLEKCLYCDKDSLSKNLCIKCNTQKGYYPIINPSSNPKILIENKYIDCVNNKTKPINFYLNKKTNYYEPCYEKCSTCEYGGNRNENNCTSCENNFIFTPDLNTTNCVMKCKYFYFYQKNKKYICTKNNTCPNLYNKLIKDKKKCTDDCKKENIYKYYYNGECLKECPDNTKDNNDFLCRDLDKCILTRKELYLLNENDTKKEIEKLVLEYVKVFNYTNNHISFYENKIYSVIIYKNGECISSLNLPIPEIDFGECYKKAQNKFNIKDNLIIAILTEKIKDNNHSITDFSMFEPYNGEKISLDEICGDEIIYIQESLLNKLEEKKVNMTSLLYLTGQNIDVFNKDSPFYTDICYNFDKPVKKDIALKDRILIYFPNITLCESNCKINGVNLTSLKSICECKYNNFKKKNFIEDSLIYQTGVGEIKNILSHTNIEIIKCYEDIFNFKNFISNYGGFMILSFIIIQIITTIIYYLKSLYLIRKYLFEIANKYISYISSQKNNSFSTEILSLQNNINVKNSGPPKKKGKIKDNKGLNILENSRNLKSKKRKRRIKTNKKINFCINLDENSLKLSNSKEIPNSNNILLLNNQSNEIEKSKNKYNLRINKKKIFHQKSFENMETINKNKILAQKTIQSNLIINLKNNLAINITEYLNTNPDDMDYDDAIKKDKRKFLNYFTDKLKSNQLLLNTFYTNDPIRPKTIKILLLILNFELYFLINGLFFNEEYISNIFHSNEEESFSNFIYRFVDNCFYTTLVGVFVNYIIDCFFVEEKKVKGILKREKNNIFILNYEITQLAKIIQKRYKYFIVLSFIISSLNWYYVSCFNKIYPYSKGEWFETSIMIIIVMQILSIIVSFLESIIRLLSFKCKSEKLYGIIHYFS